MMMMMMMMIQGIEKCKGGEVPTRDTTDVVEDQRKDSLHKYCRFHLLDCLGREGMNFFDLVYR